MPHLLFRRCLLALSALSIALAGCSSSSDRGDPPMVPTADAAADAAPGSDAAPLPGPGAACESPSPGCAAGSFCVYEPQCSGASCPITCHLSCEGKPCAPDEWCKSEPYIHMSYCVARAAAGQPCSDISLEPLGTTNSCVDGYYCRAPTVTGPGTCQQVVSPAMCPPHPAPYECGN